MGEFDVHAEEVTNYDLWVGGTRVTSENAANITGGETVTASYDAKTNTLTLNNYTYFFPGQIQYVQPEDLVISLRVYFARLN